MKTSALIAVAASCGVLAAAAAGVTSWAVVTAGQTASTSAAGDVAGDDGVYVGDELNALLLTDAQIVALGFETPTDGISADYGVAPVEADLPCAYVVGQNPMNPAGARTLEIGGESVNRLIQQVVQFPTADAAAAEFAIAQQAAEECATFVDDFDETWTWTTITSTDQPAIVAGYGGVGGEIDRVIVFGRSANAVSYIFAGVYGSDFVPGDLAAALGAATAERLAP